jgi:hypothetical protein
MLKLLRDVVEIFNRRDELLETQRNIRSMTLDQQVAFIVEKSPELLTAETLNSSSRPSVDTKDDDAPVVPSVWAYRVALIGALKDFFDVVGTDRYHEYFELEEGEDADARWKQHFEFLFTSTHRTYYQQPNDSLVFGHEIAEDIELCLMTLNNIVDNGRVLEEEFLNLYRKSKLTDAALYEVIHYIVSREFAYVQGQHASSQLQFSIDLMNEVVEHQYPFNMKLWTGAKGHSNENISRSPECNTAACFGGWLTRTEEWEQAPGFSKDEHNGYPCYARKNPNKSLRAFSAFNEGGSAVAEFLGVSIDEAESITGENLPDVFYGVALEDITPQQVLEKLHQLKDRYTIKE